MDTSLSKTKTPILSIKRYSQESTLFTTAFQNKPEISSKKYSITNLHKDTPLTKSVSTHGWPSLKAKSPTKESSSDTIRSQWIIKSWNNLLSTVLTILITSRRVSRQIDTMRLQSLIIWLWKSLLKKEGWASTIWQMSNLIRLWLSQWKGRITRLSCWLITSWLKIHALGQQISLSNITISVSQGFQERSKKRKIRRT